MFQIINFDYHITIFRDQWDEYKSLTGLDYHLFHLTSNNLLIFGLDYIQAELCIYLISILDMSNQIIIYMHQLDLLVAINK